MGHAGLGITGEAEKEGLQAFAEASGFLRIAATTDGAGKDAGAEAIDKAGGVGNGFHGGIGERAAERGVAGFATGLHETAATVEADLAVADDQVADDGGAGIARDGGVACVWFNKEMDVNELAPGSFEICLRKEIAGGEVGHIDVGGVLAGFEIGGCGEIGFELGRRLDAFETSGAARAE